MPRKQEPLPATSLLRFRRVSEKTGLPASSLYDLMAKGAFPKPVPLSERRVAWISSEIDDWIAARIAERDQKPPSPRKPSTTRVKLKRRRETVDAA